jgi:very-short-patch-repair endonuclease
LEGGLDGGVSILRQRVDAAKRERAKELRRRMTPAERVLWEQLRTNRLADAHFRRQQHLDGFIVDFYCHAARLAVELDGGVHRARGAYDAERDRVIGGRGVLVLRFTNDQVRNDLAGVLAAIAQALAQRLP